MFKADVIFSAVALAYRPRCRRSAEDIGDERGWSAGRRWARTAGSVCFLRQLV